MQQKVLSGRLVGILLILCSAAAFGTLAIFGRFAYADGVDAITILFFRFGLAALVMWGFLLVRRETLPRGRVLWPLIGMGAIGYIGQSYSYLTAVQYASAGLVALLLYLYPSIVTLLSVLLRHERITPVKVAALALALVGTALTVGPGGGQLLGILLAISAALIR
jgi:drug/metabolite transporter (DMT)-like permease